MTWLSLSLGSRSTSGDWRDPASQSLYSQTLIENTDSHTADRPDITAPADWVQNTNLLAYLPYGGDPAYRVSLSDKNVAVPSPRVVKLAVAFQLSRPGCHLGSRPGQVLVDVQPQTPSTGLRHPSFSHCSI